ncbi:MAG: hypothetical protein KY396_03095 [Actinobacteria bacterium]|nr:hypothetical protein [Actinomycetota bacterium]
MADEIELAPDEVVEGKLFSDPIQTERDADALRMLLDHERERAQMWADGTFGPQTDVVISETDAEGRRHLLVVPDTTALLEACDPVVVGFFGRPRVDVDPQILFELEDELVARMGDHAPAGLLSYYDVELVKGAYGNVILFAAPDGPGSWAKDPVHRRAVEISPQKYHEIRLHQGWLTGRLLDAGELRVTRTRYLDYNGPEPWRAVRRFSDPGPERQYRGSDGPE